MGTETYCHTGRHSKFEIESAVSKHYRVGSGSKFGALIWQEIEAPQFDLGAADQALKNLSRLANTLNPGSYYTVPQACTIPKPSVNGTLLGLTFAFVP